MPSAEIGHCDQSFCYGLKSRITGSTLFNPKGIDFNRDFSVNLTYTLHLTRPQSSLSCLINYLLGKRLGYARGEDGKASSPLLKTRSSLPRRILIMRDDWGRVRHCIYILILCIQMQVVHVISGFVR